MRVPIHKIKKMITVLEELNQGLKKKNKNLLEIKEMMNHAWREDTQWREKGRKVIDNIIEANNETIKLFSNTITSLNNWIIKIKKATEIINN